MEQSTLEAVRQKALKLWQDNNLLGEPVMVRARTLSVQEAIGDPDDDDFPLQKGKERLMEAEFRGFKGQAFTDRFGDFNGSLAEVADMPLKNNFRRAVLVASVNATLRGLGLCDHTIHCRDNEPAQCAAGIAAHIVERHGTPRITQVGFQPKIIQALAGRFELRVLDLDPDNIGQTRHGAFIEGPEKTEEAIDWAELLVVTGSTLTNDSVGQFIGRRPAIFYGTTIAGAAALLGLERYCPMSR